jgi:hypothetical protein
VPPLAVNVFEYGTVAVAALSALGFIAIALNACQEIPLESTQSQKFVSDVRFEPSTAFIVQMSYPLFVVWKAISDPSGDHDGSSS